MKLIVGLGNIGSKYENTRHNVGFMVVEQLAKENNIIFDKSKFDSIYGQGMINGEKVLLVKPTTYMNESGRAVGPMADYFGIENEDIAVIHDDMDLELGRLRLRQKGSAGGHNGIKSLIAHLKGQNFKRFKLGIGHPDKMSVVNWVLSRFTPAESADLQAGIDKTCQALEEWLENDDFTKAMNDFN
ncbi:MAG: aminoacyl-tRNA hydrolase [Ligilactobacillus sp.]|nr:aminoacyl-tRNA hydrolase [Ligilactobacillus sp.]